MPTNRTNLKNYFQKGDKPSALQFAELIDGNLNLEDGGTVAGQTNFTKPITASIISASGTVFASDFQSAGESSQAINFNDNLNVTGSFSMNGPTFDINASSVVTIDGTQITLTTTPTDGVITLHSAHTAGQAILIDANADAGSILDIDAGILDIDVQGVTTINAGDVTITSPQISLQGNVTASGTVTTSGSIVHGNVSASGNIVASGFISASGRLQTLSHITASGNISSSGHISSSGLIVAGGAQVGALVATTLDTGQGANELFDMNQNVKTTDAVVFTTINTGQGATEVHLMDQNVRQADAVVFTTVNTGQGANELYDMNQNVTTTSNVSFGFISASGDISGSTIIGENIHSLGHITASGRIQTLSHITASGNISSSGTIIANQIHAATLFSHLDDVNTGIEFASDTVSIQGNNVIAAAFKSLEIEFNLPITTNIHTTSHITASGNVLSSGSIVHGNVSASGNIVASGFISSSGRLQTLSHITASGNISSSGNIFATDIYAVGHITASGNISASGNIWSSGNISASGDVNAVNITASGIFKGATLVATGNVSASGNIVASGFISSSGRLQTLSHITASGNISSSGTIIANSFVDTVSTKAAAGNALANAAAVDATSVIFATTDDAAKGVRLPALSSLKIGQTITVHNEAASTALRVYPASGDVIGGLAEDGHATVPAKTAIVLTKRDADKFLGYFTTVIA